MLVACIDMEGVLIPEMWPHIAEQTSLPELAMTTREMPDYPKLVQRRIELLKKHHYTLKDVRSMIAQLQPYEGATAFLSQLSQKCQVVLVSDAFYELVKPLWQQLGCPSIECHHLFVDENDMISHAQYVRQGKHEVVERFKRRGFKTLAIGDAFNDIGMLNAADTGFLFRPSVATVLAAAHLPVIEHYRDIVHQIQR